MSSVCLLLGFEPEQWATVTEVVNPNYNNINDGINAISQYRRLKDADFEICKTPLVNAATVVKVQGLFCLGAQAGLVDVQN